jgi:hypothetical protein
VVGRDVPVEIRIDLHLLEEPIRQSDLAGGVGPFPIRLPRTERRTDQDTEDTPDQETDDEVAAAAAGGGHDRKECHVGSVLHAA